MAELKEIIKLTQAQYDTLAAGGTVGDYTGLDENFIYLVQDNSRTYIDFTNLEGEVTEEIKAELQNDPSIIILYNGYYYAPQYFDEDNLAPSYYNCFEGDSHYFRYIEITWSALTFEVHRIEYNPLLITTDDEINYHLSVFINKILTGQQVNLTTNWSYMFPGGIGITFWGGVFLPYTIGNSIPGSAYNYLIGYFVSGQSTYRYSIDRVNNTITLERYNIQEGIDVKRYI